MSGRRAVPGQAGTGMDAEAPGTDPDAQPEKQGGRPPNGLLDGIPDRGMDPCSDRGADRLYVQAVEKAFRVLESFAATSAPLSLSQVAAASGLDKSGAQRMAHTLLRLGYLQQDAAGLRLGIRVLERSFDYLRADPLVRRIHPVLADLRWETQERVDFSVFDDLQIVLMIRMPSRRQPFYAFLNGQRLPSFACAGGRAVMSRLPDAQVLDIIARSDLAPLTPRTETEPARILDLVWKARDDGFALCADEIQPGGVALAAPVLDGTGHPVGAIHLTGSLASHTPESFARRFAPLLMEAAHAVNNA